MRKSLISFAKLRKKMLATIPKDGIQDMPKHRVWACTSAEQQQTIHWNSCTRELRAEEGRVEAGCL